MRKELTNPKYIEWIRTQPCVVTGFSGVVPHHIIVGNEIGRIMKNDNIAVPMHPPLHNSLNTSIHLITIRSLTKPIPKELEGLRLTKNQLFKIEHGIDLHETALRLREEYEKNSPQP